MASVSVTKKTKTKSEMKKRKEDAKTCRKWTKDVLQQFTIVLSEEENYFANNQL